VLEYVACDLHLSSPTQPKEHATQSMKLRCVSVLWGYRSRSCPIAWCCSSVGCAMTGSEVHVKMGHELRRILSQKPDLDCLCTTQPRLIRPTLSFPFHRHNTLTLSSTSNSVSCCFNIFSTNQALSFLFHSSLHREPSRDTFRRLLQRPNPLSITQFCHSGIFPVIKLLEDLPTCLSAQFRAFRVAETTYTHSL